MAKDIRQSPLFARFMHDIGWEVKRIHAQYVYMRKFPFVGFFAKMPRSKSPFPFSELQTFIRNNHIFRFKMSPFISSSSKEFAKIKKQFISHNFKVDNFPFNPTTTICIDLTQSEETLFKNFTQAKRRAVRRAIKNGVLIKKSSGIEALISIRKKQYFPFGFLVTHEMKKLWQNFFPENATLLLAFSSEKKAIGGIFLLFYDGIAYYWFASATVSGKKLFAPTLLVWEALKHAKQKGCTRFDFEGIYDERFLKAAKSWKGFTKFKEGFGGKEVVFMENFYL